MRKLLPILLFLCSPALFQAQTLISSTQLGTRTAQQLLAQFQIPFIQYGISYHRITYTTTGVQGQLDTVSGLVVLPTNPTKIYPTLVYQHGTSGNKLDVPSYNVNNNGEGTLGWLMGGMGFVAILPDYLGLGVSDGFHPYVHAATEASVAVDMLRALDSFAVQQNVFLNDQLFITGYSQGGHAGMALHREIQTNLSGEFTVTAAAHLSGPYSIGEVMRDFILSDEVYFYPAYVPNTVLSYQTVYGNLFNNVSDIFKPDYAGYIQQFYNNQITLTALNSELINKLVANEGVCRPNAMFQDSVLQNVSSTPNHPFNLALKDNNVYNWAPQSPTRIFYCMADDQVPFENSVLTLDTMEALGAPLLDGADVNSAADHGECFTPAMTQTLFFFLPLQQIGMVSGTAAPWQAGSLSIAPNPASENLTLRDLQAEGMLSIVDVSGKMMFNQNLSAGDHVLNISFLNDGLYLLRFEADGKIWSEKLVVRK